MAIKIDQVVRSKRKSIALIVKPGGVLIVRAPVWASEAQILEAVSKREEWITTAQKKMINVPLPQKPKKFVQGEEFLFLGQGYPLQIITGAKKQLELNGNFYIDKRCLPRASALFTAWYRREALAMLTARVNLYASNYGFKYSTIRITSARTRWGSCSSKGTLSFPYRLVMAPVPVIDYVVVHELVHTLEHNHQARFWARVAAIIPDYKKHIAWLKKNGNQLTL